MATGIPLRPVQVESRLSPAKPVQAVEGYRRIVPPRIPDAEARQVMLDADLEPLEPYPGGHFPWKCRSGGEGATVEADGLAGDPPGFVRCQPQAGCTDVSG